MRLHILTLVLNGMPWLAAQWTRLASAGVDFHWHIVEGASANTHCTAWCKRIEPQYSKDGTSQFIDSLKVGGRVSVYRNPMWDGKVSMCNAALETIKEPCVLLQMDSDELWTGEQLRRIKKLFNAEKTHAYFWCRYFFGPDIVMTSRNCYANNPKQEWKRAWRFEPGKKFITHEPPVLEGEQNPVLHAATEQQGMVFDHYGYALPSQVAFKEKFYGYTNALDQWQRLQANQSWPAKLCDYLSWVKDDRCLVSRI